MRSISRKTKLTNSDKTRITKEEMYMEIAHTIAKRSTCKRLHVGAVIVDPSLKNIIAIGYNGNYAGGPNTCDSDVPGQCGCIHGEINALLKGGRRMNGKDAIFVTAAPCPQCAKAVINAGIKTVYYHDDYRYKEGLKILRKVGVKVKKM